MKMLKRALVLVFVLILAACGGGGGSAGTPVLGSGAGTSVVGGGSGSTGTGTTTTTSSASVIVAITSTTVTASTPATVTATVRDAAGALKTGQVVSFSSTGSLGAFTPATALTDANGVATTQLSPASSTANGADLIVAATTVGAAAVTGNIGFQIVASGKTASGNPTISLSLSTTSVSTAAPGTLTAAVADSTGAPLSGQVVKFSSVDGLGLFTPASGLTDSTGKVVVKLTPTSTTSNGADLAVAQTTVSGTQLSTTVGFATLAGASSTAAGTPTLSVALSTTSVTSSTPATVTAVLRDALGAGVAGQVVKFSTVDGLGTFSVASALTDSGGSASVSLTAVNATSSGADQVIASATLAGTALQASKGFQLTVANLGIASFSSDVGTAALSAYGQSNLTVKLSGASAGTSASIALSSTCVAKGKATLTPASATTTTGSATFTYRDNGCGSTDPFDSLQANVTGSAAVATLQVNLSTPSVGSISFVSASPQTIYLKASGYQENSTVLFRVLDAAGNGVPNRSVDLVASTLAGGLTIDGGNGPLTKLSDSLGNVTVLVNSGTVPTPVRIKATLTGGTITTVSSSLSIAVGRPSQLNFSLSQQTFNIEGLDIDGTPNTYSIIASDRLANPVPAGTAINFVAEGGSIEASKFTALSNGLARTSANFISSSPRPADGRITVVAYALGEESFIDLNGNNVWDAGEPFQDLGNIYIDRLYNGVYESAQDQFIALSIPGVSQSQACVAPASEPGRTLLALDKGIPSIPGTCDGTWGQAYVRRSAETVLSSSSARPIWLGTDGVYSGDGQSCSNPAVARNTPIVLNLVDGYLSGVAHSMSYVQVAGTRLFLPSGATTGSFGILVADANGIRLNPMAAGTLISATATTGITPTVSGSTVPSTLDAPPANIGYTFAAGTVSGEITISFKSPSGLTTSIVVPVSTATPPSTGACP